MEIDQILKLLQAVSDSDVDRFSMEEGNLKLSIRKSKKQGEMPVVMVSGETETVQKKIVQEKEPEGMQIKAPLVGTFYHAPAPDEAPYVQVGDHVSKGQTLGIIEAMKLMNEIQSEKDGVVTAILVENEQMVEYGQPLFVIR